MFERFTERARQVVVLGDDEARMLKHNFIGTEHLLVGLVREKEGLGARVLESHGITVERVRAQVVRIVGSGEEVPSGQIPLTPRTQKIFELALREALSIGHNYVGTEHILLGLVRENEGVAALILLDFDADYGKIRNEVLRVLNAPGGGRGRPIHSAPPSVPATLLEGASGLLTTVIGEIEERLARPADAGDLLIVLACLPDGLVASALASLGIDTETLARAVEDARRGGARSALLPPIDLAAEIEKAREEKEAKFKAQEFVATADRHWRELELTRKADAITQPCLDDILAQVRERLGLIED